MRLNAQWGRRALLALFVVPCLLLVAVAQEPEPPEPTEEQPEEPKGSLQPRPEDDPQTRAWVGTLIGARARSLSAMSGPVLRHVLTPEGDRFYYYREASRSEGKEGEPPVVTYALYAVGPDKAEAKIADTGADALPPLFLSDGRLVFTARRYDHNDDKLIDEQDDCALIVCNRDGGSLRQVATLAAGETPVAAWREDRELLIATRGEDEVNGWIVSLNLVSGNRERVVEAFNVSMVLDDGRILIERMQAIEPPKRPIGWGRQVQPEEEAEQPKPSLLDHVEYLLFEPKDSTVTSLLKPSRKSQLVAVGEGSYFGTQERDAGGEVRPSYAARQQRRGTEILIVDDAEHRDTRAPSSKYNYEVLAWIENRGLLVVERGNLGSRLLLMDRALTFHRLADFDLAACGFRASRDGLTVGWLEVEDTDKNGKLEPWLDHARPYMLKIE